MGILCWSLQGDDESLLLPFWLLLPLLSQGQAQATVLVLSLRLMLTPAFSMEDMDMDTLDTVDTMGTHMVDLPTMDKLFPLNRQPTILVFFISDHIFSA